MARKKCKGTELSVFKGREARLNHAVLLAAAYREPLTIYEIHKEIVKMKGLGHTRYANVNKRVKLLTEQGFLRKAGSRITKVGLRTTIFQCTTKALLSLAISLVKIDDLIANLNEEGLLTLLSLVLVKES